MVRVTCVSRYRRQLVDDECGEEISGGRRTPGGWTRKEMGAGRGGDGEVGGGMESWRLKLSSIIDAYWLS